MTGAGRLWTITFVLLPFVFWADIYEGALLPRLLVLQIGLALVAVWLALRRDRQQIPQRLLILTALWIAAQSASLLQSTNQTESFLQLSHYLSLSLVPLLFAATMSARDLLPLARSIAIASIPVSIIGICQYLGVGFLELPSQAQPSATFFHRNAAAGYLTAVVGLSGLCAAKSGKVASRWIYILATGLAVVYLVFTRTRGAWVAVAAASVVVIALHFVCSRQPIAFTRRGWTVAAALCLTIVVAGLLPDRMAIQGKSTFDDKKDTAMGAVASIVTPGGHRGRLGLWQNTSKMIADFPVLGVGLGNWEFVYPDYARGDHVRIDAAPRRPHNDLLWVASETGIIGLAAYVSLMLFSILAGVRVLRFGSVDHRQIALAALFVCIAHLVDGLFNFPRERIGGASLFWLSIGVLWILDRRGKACVGIGRYAWIPVLILAWSAYTTSRRIGYDYHHLRVHAAERRGDWLTVVDQGNKAIAYGSLRANTWIAMGRAHYRGGRIEQAINAHQTALRLHPNSLNAHNNLGIALRKAGRTEEAILALRRAIELYPVFVEAHNNLGNALRDAGQISASINIFEKILSEPNARRPQIYVNLARSYVVSGDTTRARASYHQALRLEPENKPAKRELRLLQPRTDHGKIDRS